MKAMILAAGKGERMLPLTATTPKPLLKVGGKSLIQHQIEKLASNGITEIVINYSYLGEKIEEALGNGSDLGVHIVYSPESEPLETAGGILQALPLLGAESFIVVNADIWTDFPFKKLVALDGKGCLGHLVMVDNAEHHSTGDYALGENGLLSLPKDSEQKTLTFSGISVYHPAFFAGNKPGKLPLRPLFKTTMTRNQLSGEYYQGEWIDVGTPDRLEALQPSH